MTTTTETAPSDARKSGSVVRTDAFDVVTEVAWDRLYKRHPNGLKRARELAHHIVKELRREQLITGLLNIGSTEEILQSAVDKAAKEGEAPRRGVSHFAAEALVLLNLPTVHRDVVAALMPDIRSSEAKASVQVLFNRAIRKFDNFKWIRRDEDGTLAVLDPGALAQWFNIAEDGDGKRASTPFNIAKAILQLNTRFAAGNADELHRRELHAIQRLMTSAPGSVTNERGAVRVLSQNRVL